MNEQNGDLGSNRRFDSDTDNDTSNTSPKEVADPSAGGVPDIIKSDSVQQAEPALPAGTANNPAEIMATLRPIHANRFEQLRGSGLVPELNLDGIQEVNETFFYICWCSNETQAATMPLIQQIATGSESAIREVIGSKVNTYCVLTTSSQYTIAGPIWTIAFMHAIYGNKVDLMDSMLANIDLNEKLTVFCPLEGGLLKKSYMAQPLGVMMLMSTNPANIKMQVFNFLLDKVPSNAVIAWDEFSTTLNTAERKTGLLEVLLLEKMIEQGKPEFAVALIKRNPKLLREPSSQGTPTLFELIIKKDQLQILDNISEDHKPVIEVVDEMVLKLLAQEASSNLSKEQKDKLTRWHDTTKKTITTPLGRACAVGVYLLSTPLAFFSAIAFSGIGDLYLKEVLAEAGMPTGMIPAGITVLVISGISAVLTEWNYGLIDKQTTGSFIISAILPLFPGVPPGGPRIQDSLGIVDRSKAIAEAATALLMLFTVGIGLMFISKLPVWSAACAALPPYHLMIYVTVATAVINAVAIPPFCQAFCDAFSSGGKGIGRW